MDSKELEEKAVTTLNSADVYSENHFYLKAIAYFLYAILKELEAKVE